MKRQKRAKKKHRGLRFGGKTFLRFFTEGCLPYGITSVTSSTTLRSAARRIKVVLHIKKKDDTISREYKKKQKGLGIRGIKIS